jgi:P-type E1-E2 ATPase
MIVYFNFLSVVGMAKGSSLQDLVYMGLVGICDPPRPFVRESIQTLLQSGVKVKLVTGDAQETATAIGKYRHMLLKLRKESPSTQVTLVV